jgi:hypothetical protein
MQDASAPFLMITDLVDQHKFIDHLADGIAVIEDEQSGNPFPTSQSLGCEVGIVAR